MSWDFEVSGFPSAWGKLRFQKYLYAMGMHMPLLTELENLLAGASTNMSHLRRFWTCAFNLFSIGGCHGSSNRLKDLMV